MPTLTELRTKVSRDLRDPNKRTFLDTYLDDFINAGAEEVGRVYPPEVIDAIAPVAATYAYATECVTAFRAELWRSGRFHTLLTDGQAGDDSQAGWDLFAGMFRLPKTMLDAAVPATDEIRLWGYGTYPVLVNPADVLTIDATGEQGIRRFIRAHAFQLMHADRALFKQWQGQSNNTDVTVNQLNQMVAFYTGEWDRTRNYLRRLRRN